MSMFDERRPEDYERDLGVFRGLMLVIVVYLVIAAVWWAVAP